MDVARRSCRLLPGVLVALTALACTPPKAASSAGRDAVALPSAPKHLELIRPGTSGGNGASPLLTVLAEELARNVRELGKSKDRDATPYFVSYEATDEHVVEVEGSFGTLVGATDDRSRTLDVDVRVGTHKLDNTHRLRGDYDVSRDFTRQAFLPIDDDSGAIRSVAWLATHAEYQRAVEDLVRVKANMQVKVAEEDASDDFSTERSSTYHEAPATLSVDRAAWEARVRRLSAPFAKHPELLESRVRFEGAAATRYFASSEGASVQVARLHGRVEVSASTIADDGMRLERIETVDAPNAAGLPDDEAVLTLVERIITDLGALRRAPVVEPYAGPAILDGRAAAVFFHEIFGHRVEGHRQKDEEEGQTFAHQIGQPVMPEFLDVFDDPSIARLNGIPLNGYYPYDDEGIPGGKALLVDRGKLREFLLSRSVPSGFHHSNGHGRREHGHRVVSRQGNLVVDPRVTTTKEALKQRLIDEIVRQGKPFGLRFHEITGGYTNTTRYGSQAFKVLPVMVYRIYPDGREELVRGVDLEGTPLASLTQIEAAANDFEVFDGVCGAESGWVPVSATSPSILLGQIEVTRQEKSHDRPPLLPAPTAAAARRDR